MHRTDAAKACLVAALFPVVMHAHLVALVMMIAVCECRRHAHEASGRSDQCQNNLLHFESSKSERKRAAIVARQHYDFLEIGRSKSAMRCMSLAFRSLVDRFPTFGIWLREQPDFFLLAGRPRQQQFLF
ncbi:hypothetical protein G3N95_34100 [Paraburkholderia sp. Tr-20389]|uniref:hypothetical protein n=1 Tax=Paraburkholderia sp. Tr-20389 TaxID=2703903 RepID=UPI00197EED97|nr:hypothetical protein [Paraburkholderia sp. Tr-20389]MBN3757991.1 hypothetical protein [Paraburkholderia sp. Tr-20389]